MNRFLFFIFFIITSCNAGEHALEEDSISNEVHIYTARDYDTDNKLYQLFEEETGIKVVLTKDKGENLIQKIQNEGKSTKADLLFCIDAGQLNYATKLNLFRPLRIEALDESVPLDCRELERHWFGISKRAKVMVYNKDLIDSSSLGDYTDLAESRWANKILIGASRSVSNRSLLASFVANIGKDKTLEWISGIADNMTKVIKGREMDQIIDVFEGKAAVAIVNTNVIGQFLTIQPKAIEKLAVFFPNQNSTGTHLNLSGAGIIAGSRNYKNTVKLLVFLTSKLAQEQLSNELFEYPVNPSATRASLLSSWGNHQMDRLDLIFLEQNQDIVEDLLNLVTW